MLTAKQAREITKKAQNQSETDKWKPLFLQIEASASQGFSSIDCMNLSLPKNYKREELKALIEALGYQWSDEDFGYFSISWHPPKK